MSILDALPQSNPWLSLEAGNLPYCTPEDLPFIQAHNARLASRYNPEKARDYHLPLDVFPEPYLGHPDAPILLLNLNPGYKDGDAAVHARQPIMNLCSANLRHTLPAECPFYPLHPRYVLNGGSRWWSLHLGDWIRQYSKEHVARAFFCIELFPYASRKYCGLPDLVPSQRYSIALAAAKINSGCPVIVMRAEAQWQKLVPELKDSTCFRLKSSQSGYLSEKNLSQEAVDRINSVFRALR